jgi:MFS family permease
MRSPERPASPWWTAAPAVFVMLWGGNQFTPLLTVYRDRLHFSDATVYVLLGGYVLGLIPALLLGSRASVSSPRIVWLGLICGGVATATLMLGQASVLITGLGRVVAGVSVGIAMSSGVSLIRALRIARRPDDTRGAVVTASMTLTAGLAAGAGAAGVLAAYGTEPVLGPYVLHLVVLVVAATFLGLCRPLGARPAGTREVTTGRSATAVTTWKLTAFVAPWIFVAGSVSYGLIPGLVTDIPVNELPAYGAVAALITLVVGTAVQPWASRLVVTGPPPYTLALLSVTTGLGLVIPVSVSGSALLGLVATVPLGLGFGIALASGAVRAEAVATATGRKRLVANFYALTYTGFAAPAVIAAVALRTGYPAAIAAAAVAAALAVAVSVAWEPRPNSDPFRVLRRHRRGSRGCR